MPDVGLQNHELLVATQEPGIAYGNAFLTIKFPSGEPYLEAWNQKNESEPFKIKMDQQMSQFPTSVESQENYKTYFGYSLGCRNVGRQGFVCLSTATQTDLLDSEEDQVRELIIRIRTSLPIPYREKIADRLITLFYDAKEEDYASVGIAVGSLQSFYKFLQLYTNLKCPTISLTPENNIYASWRAGQNRVFSVHFLPDGDTRFVMFKPNDLHPERQIRLSGTATADILMGTVTPRGEGDWIYE